MRDILSDLEDGTPEEKDPVRRAQAKMHKPLPKRFYSQVSVGPHASGFAILLDGKPVRTPARADFVVPAQDLALDLAAEWDAQIKEINPAAMPLTRMVNTAIDGVASASDAVIAEVLAYAGSDLLCYRAATPAGLAARQAALWDPYLDWAANSLGARFILSEGVVHVTQPPEAIAATGAALRRHASPLAITGLHTLTTMTGSVILALALLAGHRSIDDIWSAAHVDEDWNIAHWGEDHEAAARRAHRRKDALAAARLIEAVSRQATAFR